MSDVLRIAVVGAGVSGLTTHYRLEKLAAAQGRALAVETWDPKAAPGGNIGTHQGEGFRVGPNTTIWVTPGHSPQDASLVVDTAAGRQAFTHLWWRSDRTPEVDPYSVDPAVLADNRKRVLDGVDVVIPGHGAPFRVR